MTAHKAWPSLASLSPEKITEALDLAVAGIRQQFAAPRDPATAALFLRQYPLKGRCYLYGAGSHTRTLLPELREMPDLEILGLIDRRAAHLGQFEGLPVVTPEQACAASFDRILLSHTCRERDMAATLARLGVGADRIRGIYEDPRYLSFAWQHMAVPAAQARPYCVIRSARGQVVEDEALPFPPERTAYYFIGRDEYREPRERYRQVDLKQSLHLLAAQLEGVSPRVVYLSTGWYNNFLAPVIRRLVPDAVLIHEVYDWNLLFGSGALSDAVGLDETRDLWNQLGEFESTQRAEVVVSKRDPGAWTAGFRAQYLSYYAGARQAAAAPVRPHRGKRLLYGGLLPHPDLLASYTQDYDFLPLMERIARRDQLEIDLYNSLDRGRAAREEFAPYRARYPDSPLRYRSGLDYAAFLDRARDYDYGWLASVAQNRQSPDQTVLVPGRAIGYLAAGLPVIVDPGWSLTAQMVDDHQAGIVLRDFEPAAVAATIEQADQQRHRNGAHQLAARLVAHNRNQQARLAALVQNTPTETSI